MSELIIRRVAIVGSGTTGAALAAHLVNLGFSVSLLDMTAALAAEGMERARPTLYVPERAGEIRCAGIDDAVTGLEEADWVIEAVTERLDVKHDIYARIAPRLRLDAVITTCSGSLPVGELAAGLPDAFSSRFFAAYFALPIHERRLVELRPGPLTDPVLVKNFAAFLSGEVARRVVTLPPTLAGVVTRYGIWCLFLGMQVAEKLRLDVEDVEAITGTFMDHGPEGIFHAVDRIGLDELRDVAANLRQHYPDDRGARFLELPTSAIGLLARGWTGDKAGQGFLRREGREKLALNLTTMAYRQARDSALPGLSVNPALSLSERLRAATAVRDEVGEFLREFLVPCLRYAEYLRDQTGLSVLDFDRSMEWGFGWPSGPFALLDSLKAGATRYYEGPTYLTPSGSYAPIPIEGTCQTIEDCPVVDRATHYTTHDLGDGIQAVALADGVLTPSRVEGLIELFKTSKLSRFVLTSAGVDFPGLDLMFMFESFRTSNPLAVDAYLANLQTLGELLESKTCVAAIHGRCVGPGLGLALSCPVIVASADTEIGFPEGRLGILPTARGLALLRSLHGDSAKRMGEVTVILAEGIVAHNADLARHLGFLRATDITEYLPERLLTTAKRIVQTVSASPRSALPNPEGPLIGIIDRGLADRRARGGLTDHDVTVGQRIRQVIARTATYDECLDRERSETIDLGSKALSLARFRHMLETGKPLRN